MGSIYTCPCMDGEINGIPELNKWSFRHWFNCFLVLFVIRAWRNNCHTINSSRLPCSFNSVCACAVFIQKEKMKSKTIRTLLLAGIFVGLVFLIKSLPSQAMAMMSAGTFFTFLENQPPIVLGIAFWSLFTIVMIGLLFKFGEK